MKISTIRWMHSQINVTLGDNIIVVFWAGLAFISEIYIMPGRGPSFKLLMSYTALPWRQRVLVSEF